MIFIYGYLVIFCSPVLVELIWVSNISIAAIYHYILQFFNTKATRYWFSTESVTLIQCRLSTKWLNLVCLVMHFSTMNARLDLSDTIFLFSKLFGLLEWKLILLPKLESTWSYNLELPQCLWIGFGVQQVYLIFIFLRYPP